MKTKLQTLHSVVTWNWINLLSGEMAKMKALISFVVGYSCAVNSITEEPDAVIPHVRICVGAPR